MINMHSTAFDNLPSLHELKSRSDGYIVAKAQCVKVLEEASECCEAAKEYVKNLNDEEAEEFRYDFIDEFCDLRQAMVNMEAMFELTQDEVGAGMIRCYYRNYERGRYERRD